MGRPVIDLTGQRFGRLLVVSQVPRESAKAITYWNCLCDCGTPCVVRSGDLRKKRGGTRSCGCLNRELASNRLRTHGGSVDVSRRRLYRVWLGMRSRCCSPTHKYYFRYGGRGITICPDWLQDFENFWRDMSPSFQSGLTLDRIDNNAGYSKSNCRWVTRKVQNNNRRDNVWIETPAGRLTLKMAAEYYGLNFATLRQRISYGWPQSKWFVPADSGQRVLAVNPVRRARRAKAK